MVAVPQAAPSRSRTSSATSTGPGHAAKGRSEDLRLSRLAFLAKLDLAVLGVRNYAERRVGHAFARDTVGETPVLIR